MQWSWLDWTTKFISFVFSAEDKKRLAMEVRVHQQTQVQLIQCKSRGATTATVTQDWMPRPNLGWDFHQRSSSLPSIFPFFCLNIDVTNWKLLEYNRFQFPIALSEQSKKGHGYAATGSMVVVLKCMDQFNTRRGTPAPISVLDVRWREVSM